MRSFREAWKRDPDCAICYWGEGWAWGSYLNGPMSAEQSPFAYAATQKAISLARQGDAEGARVHRRARASATSRISRPPSARNRIRPTPMRWPRSPRSIPDDLDAITLYADALFLLEPRRGTRDVNAPNIKRLHGVLESALQDRSKHPGACHLYVHATESTVRPGLPKRARSISARPFPARATSTTCRRTPGTKSGRWGDSVRANTEAWHSDLKADAGEGFAIYPDHNLHMLLYAASMDGQGARAIQAGKDYAKRTSDAMYHALTLVRFGRFDEVVELTKRPEREIPAAAFDFSMGYAKLKLGEPEFAKAYLAKVKKVADTSKVEFRSHPAARLVGVLAEHPRRRDHAHGRRRARRDREVRNGGEAR